MSNSENITFRRTIFNSVTPSLEQRIGRFLEIKKTVQERLVRRKDETDKQLDKRAINAMQSIGIDSRLGVSGHIYMNARSKFGDRALDV